MDDEALEAAFNTYLDNLHTTLWGQAIDITTPEGRRRAFEWLDALLGEIGEVMYPK